MSTVEGIVIEKSYLPPPGAPAKYWCYLMVETPKKDRVRIRLHQSIHEKFAIGDHVKFDKPWRKNKRVRSVKLA